MTVRPRSVWRSETDLHGTCSIAGPTDTTDGPSSAGPAAARTAGRPGSAAQAGASSWIPGAGTQRESCSGTSGFSGEPGQPTRFRGGVRRGTLGRVFSGSLRRSGSLREPRREGAQPEPPRGFLGAARRPFPAPLHGRRELASQTRGGGAPESQAMARDPQFQHRQRGPGAQPVHNLPTGAESTYWVMRPIETEYLVPTA